VQAGVASSGVANPCVHTSSTRYANTVTAAALYICMRLCFQVYCEDMTDNCSKKAFAEREQSIQLRYWGTALQVELIVLSFVHSGLLMMSNRMQCMCIVLCAKSCNK